MATVASPTLHTPESFLALPDSDSYELVDGLLVERKMGTWSSYVTGRIFSLLFNYNEANPAGHVFPEGTSYQCFPNMPGKVRRADVSFIRFGRLAGESIPIGHILIAPDLAVEVISPTDTVDDVDEKIAEYFQAGVGLVWVIHPVSRTVEVQQPAVRGLILRANDELNCEELLPGFRAPVSSLFEVKTPNRS